MQAASVHKVQLGECGGQLELYTVRLVSLNQAVLKLTRLWVIHELAQEASQCSDFF